MERPSVWSPYAANIADLDGGGRRRRKSSGFALGTDDALERGEVSNLGEVTFGELAIDKSDLGKASFLRANGRRSFLLVGGGRDNVVIEG